MLNGRPINLLLVEDDPAHAEIVKRSLAEFRVANRLVHLEDGQAAMDYLQRRPEYADLSVYPRPDLVLLDLRIPKVDGLEVLRRMRQDPELQRMPTVILTTSKADMDLAEAYRNGASSYLAKPVDFEKFARLMEVFGFYWLMWNEFPKT